MKNERTLYQIMKTISPEIAEMDQFPRVLISNFRHWMKARPIFNGKFYRNNEYWFQSIFPKTHQQIRSRSRTFMIHRHSE
jgi:hypothetical protein